MDDLFISHLTQVKLYGGATAGESGNARRSVACITKNIVIGGHVWDNASSECFRAIGLALQFWISVSISPQVTGSNLITVHNRERSGIYTVDAAFSFATFVYSAAIHNNK